MKEHSEDSYRHILKYTGLFGGVQGSADEAVKALIEGRLDYDPDARCDHHDHEEGGCEHESCCCEEH